MVIGNTWIQEFQDRTWLIGDEEVMRIQTLTKDAEETTKFSFDFSERAEMKEGDSIDAIVVLDATPSGLTLSDEDVDGDAERVTVMIAGGTSSARYTLRCKVLTFNGYTIVGRGNLEIF